MSIKKSIKLIFISGRLVNILETPDTRPPHKIVIDYFTNASKMISTAKELIELGFVPFVPCLYNFLGIYGNELKIEDYKKINFEFLKRCDAMLVISLSPGVLEEIEFARQHNIPIFYSIPDILSYKKE